MQVARYGQRLLILLWFSLILALVSRYVHLDVVEGIENLFHGPKQIRPSHYVEELTDTKDVDASRHLLVLIKTGPAALYKERRDNLRESWLNRCRHGNHYPPGVPDARERPRGAAGTVTLSCYFVVGTRGLTTEQRAALNAEHAENRDIVWADGVRDYYATMMLKTMWMLDYAVRRGSAPDRAAEDALVAGGTDRQPPRPPLPPVTHVMLADDDVFVALSVLIGWLRRLPLVGVYTGHAHLFSTPIFCERMAHANCIRRADYPHAHYPPYASGFAYLLSVDVCVGTVQAALRRSYLRQPVPGNNEDAFVGLLAAEAGFRLVHEPAFHHYAQQQYSCPGQGVAPMVIGNAPIPVLQQIAGNEWTGEVNLCHGVD